MSKSGSFVVDGFAVTVYSSSAIITITPGQQNLGDEALSLTYQQVQAILSLSPYMGEIARLDATTSAVSYIPGIVISQAFEGRLQMCLIKHSQLTSIWEKVKDLVNFDQTSEESKND